MKTSVAARLSEMKWEKAGVEGYGFPRGAILAALEPAGLRFEYEATAVNINYIVATSAGRVPSLIVVTYASYDAEYSLLVVRRPPGQRGMENRLSAKKRLSRLDEGIQQQLKILPEGAECRPPTYGPAEDEADSMQPQPSSSTT